MKKVLSHINRGFSLVELLVAVSVFLVFVIAVSDVTTGVSRQSLNSANRERAIVLAEEALEATRNIRDADFANLADGVYGLATSSNIWNFVGASDTKDIFTRSLAISTINENQKKADVTISWSDQVSPTNSLTLSTYFTNWRSILNLEAGLTVNKTVINHGGTKVAADFAPYQVGTTTVNLGVASQFLPGTYPVTETADSNYTTTFSGDCDSSGSITLSASTTNTCVITNEEKPSRLTVTKVVINHGGTKTASDFTLTVDSNPVVSGATNIFNSGTHTVSEVPDSGYIKTISGDCDSGGLVTLVTNTTKSCTVTNEQMVVPTVTTPTSASITSTSTTLGATVSSLGVPAAITARGVCYNTAGSPTLANGATCVTATLAQTLTAYTVNVTGLNPGTTYKFAGYATNSAGTGYSADGTFTTLASTITFVGQGTANGTTATIPAHNVGDLLVVFAYRDGNNTPPTIPAGWTTISSSAGSNNNSSALAYRIATGSDSGSGFSGGTEIIVQAYRGVSASPIGANGVQQGNGNTVTYPAISLNVTNGSSWVIGFAGDSDKNTTIETPPTGMTARANIVGGSAEASGSDTNGGVSSWSAKTVSVGKAVNWSVRTLEIKSN